MSDNYIPHVVANEQAMAYWKDLNNFPIYKPTRTRIDKLINPQTRKERRRAKRFAGLLGAVAVMALTPKPVETQIYDGK